MSRFYDAVAASHYDVYYWGLPLTDDPDRE